ncbi:MAG: HAMP domain-containing histidine kinase [Lentimicrobium sp.]|nr:HAMP domain-containing histidine kinase [Lentimicrobium sp.]
MSQPITYFAPAGRKGPEEIVKDYAFVTSNQLTVSILDGIPTLALLLNHERQIVFSNKAFLDYFQLKDNMAVIGLRPGEAAGCPFVKDGPDGCGTSKNCKVCGGVKAILNCLNNGQDTQEVTINNELNQPLHFSVTTKILNIEHREFLLFSLVDISTEKKKAILERLFYHDILNTAHNINSMAELLSSEDLQDNRHEYLGFLMKSTSAMIDEINTHRIISNGNHLEYISQPVPVDSLSLFNELKTEFESGAPGVQIIALDNRSESFTFNADKVLLKRVVTNMVKNALEAEQGAGIVTLGFMSLQDRGTMIWVHNASFMSEEVQMQVFNRSFSTKGNDRGLGTYSMKILNEKFMKGKISFTSSPTNGTTFIIEIPAQI